RGGDGGHGPRSRRARDRARAGSHPDGSRAAWDRRVGSDAPPQRERSDPARPDRGLERARNDQRSRDGARGRRRRLRHQAGPLPVAAREDRASDALGEPAGMTRHDSILVVDDSELNRDGLSRRLRQRGYTVAMAASGSEALAMAAAVRFDLILLDVEMPSM